MTTFTPDAWLTGLWRSLKTYIEDQIDTDIFKIVEGYPAADELVQQVPLEKTIIHLDIGDIRQIKFGLGDNFVDREYQEPDGTVIEWEAIPYEVDIDIGIWACVESGGVTARMQAYEQLSKAFAGPSAHEACLTATDGVEVLSISGGRNVIDTISDIQFFRMVDITLRVRVFARLKVAPTTYIHEIDQFEGIEIDGTVIVG